jgi:hypothetical protein
MLLWKDIQYAFNKGLAAARDLLNVLQKRKNLISPRITPPFIHPIAHSGRGPGTHCTGA